MKKFDERIKYYCYEYAPESFRLYIKNKIGKYEQINLSFDNTRTLGNLYISNKKELDIQIKKLIRNKLISKKIDNNVIMALKQSNNTCLYLQGMVNRYNLNQKIIQFKNLKECFKNNNKSSYNITSGAMNDLGIFEENKEAKKQLEIMGLCYF